MKSNRAIVRSSILGLYNRATQFIRNNYLLAIFILIIGLVGVIIFVRLFTAKDETVYVKVKVSQGLWWASTLKPAIWLADSLQKGDVELGLDGKPLVQLIEVRKYPMGTSYNNEQYEVYLTVKMDAAYNKNLNRYTYKRTALTIGAPIEFEFQKAHITGTVYSFSEKPFEDVYTFRTVTLVRNSLYQEEYDMIQPGETYFDGEDVIIEILDKRYEDVSGLYSRADNNYPLGTERRLNIFVTVKMRLKKQNNMLLYREDYPIQNGKNVSFQTPSYFFDQYKVIAIE